MLGVGRGKSFTYLSTSLDHYLSILDGLETKLLSERRGPFTALNEIHHFLKLPTTKYKLCSIQLDAYENRRQNYWSSISEMAARAFNSYLIDRLSEKGVRNDYLCFEFEFNSELEKLKAYPEGDDRKILNELFDNLIEELKEKEVFDELESSDDYFLSRIYKTLENTEKQLTFNI